ncbi:hypothetical protein Q604_UNBC07862G0001, partial [human gut metagenome]
SQDLFLTELYKEAIGQNLLGL